LNYLLGNPEITQQNVSQMTSFQNPNQSSGLISDNETRNYESGADYKLKRTIQRHYQMPSQTRDSNHIEVNVPYRRDSQQIVNIHTDGSEVDVEQSTYQEINTLQAIKQTTLGRPFRHHANEDSLNYSLSPKNPIAKNKNQQFYTFKNKTPQPSQPSQPSF
jgi:hypothetical protein